MKKSGYKKILDIKNNSWLMIIFLVASMLFIFGNRNVYAEWIEPSSPPPTEKFSAPLTTTGEPQAKEGYLLLDPVSYHPTQSTSLNFFISKPLVVMGDGSKFSTPFVYSDTLVVDTDTLYVDSASEWVGIGTNVSTGTEKLKIEGGAVQVGSSSQPITGKAVSSYSNNNYGIYSDAGSTSLAAVYGLRTASDGWAVKGESEGDKVGVRGESVSGAGINAVTNSPIYGAVYGSNSRSGWAGYFDGSLGSVSDMVARRFLPTGLQKSLIPFTSGQEIASYEFGTWSVSRQSADLAFDGTYIWAVTSMDDNNKSLFKIRASDGVLVNSYDLGYTSTIFGLTFDGQYLWFVYNDGTLAKFDPVAEATSTYNIGLIDTLPSKSLAMSEENGSYYLWVYKASTINTDEAIIKININDGTIVGTYLIDSLFVGAGVYNPNGIIFDGEYIWISAESGYLAGAWAEDPNDVNHPVRVFDTLVTGQYNCVPSGVEFDGENIWCMTGTGVGQTLLKIWPTDIYNSQHPVENIGSGMTQDLANVKTGVFDGTYFWALDEDGNSLYRFLMADTSQYKVFNIGFSADEIVFDGTYLWLAEVAGSRLHKFYSGTGLGYTNLSSLVNLNPLSQQTGNINISSASEIGTDITVGADVDTVNNLWGGLCDDDVTYCTTSADCTGIGTGVCYGHTVPVVGGVASCSDGEFMGGVELDVNSEIINIYCWKL